MSFKEKIFIFYAYLLAKNLIKNIGFGVEGATHTKSSNARYENMQRSELNFPRKHPYFVCIDKKFDHLNFQYHF